MVPCPCRHDSGQGGSPFPALLLLLPLLPALQGQQGKAYEPMVALTESKAKHEGQWVLLGEGL